MQTDYLLRIHGPDLGEIDHDTAAEIKSESDVHDTKREAVDRWLGGFVDEYVGALSAALPEGWYAKADGT